MLSRALTTLAFALLAVTTLNGCGRKKPPKAPEEEEERTSAKDANLDHYDDQLAVVKSKMPDVEKGSAIVVRFLNQGSGKRISLVYVDETPPQFKEKLNGRVIVAKASGKGDETLSTISFLIKNFEPGRYECNTANHEAVIGAAIADNWVPTDPETYWSLNEGGGCEIELHEGARPGDIEGSFRGRLVKNNGKGFLIVENGYIYVKRF
jgi:hypothetical protein